MSYLSNLRKVVGSRPLLSAGATILVFNSKNELLLNLRSDTNTWGIPGGAMELGEELVQTAKRELYEETGLRTNNFKFLNIFSGNDFYFKYPNGDELYSVVTLFKAEELSGVLRINDDESKKLEYFDLNHLPQLESRALKIIDWVRCNLENI